MGSTIIFHLSKLWIVKFSMPIRCNIAGEDTEEIWSTGHWSSGAKDGTTQVQMSCEKAHSVKVAQPGYSKATVCQIILVQ